VGQSKKGLTSITIGFNEALNPSSATNTDLYKLFGSVKKHGKTAYTKGFPIESISYASGGKTVKI